MSRLLLILIAHLFPVTRGSTKIKYCVNGSLWHKKQDILWWQTLPRRVALTREATVIKLWLWEKQQTVMNPPPTHVSVSLSIGGSPLTWQWGLGLAKYRRQCRRSGETASKRLSGSQAIGSAGTWMNLRDNKHVVSTWNFTAILLTEHNYIQYYHVYLCVWDRADWRKRQRGHVGLEEPWG